MTKTGFFCPSNQVSGICIKHIKINIIVMNYSMQDPQAVHLMANSHPSIGCGQGRGCSSKANGIWLKNGVLGDDLMVNKFASRPIARHGESCLDKPIFFPSLRYHSLHIVRALTNSVGFEPSSLFRVKLCTYVTVSTSLKTSGVSLSSAREWITSPAVPSFL